jgi:anti-sigma factor RsiW
VAVQAELSGYLDNALPPDEMNRIEQHLAVCQRCQDELALLQAMVMTMTMAPRPTPSPTIRDRLLAQIVSETVIERVALMRRQRDGAFSTIRHCKTEPLMPTARRIVSETAPNLDRSEQDRSEHLIIYRSATTRHSTTVYRRTVRS